MARDDAQDVMVSIFPDAFDDIGKIKNVISTLFMAEWVDEDDCDGLGMAMSGEAVADISYIWQSPSINESAIKSLSEAMDRAISNAHLPYEVSDVQIDRRGELVMLNVEHIRKSDKPCL